MKNASQLLQEMNHKLLSIIGSGQYNPDNIKAAIDIVSSASIQLKAYILTNPFTDNEEEINFFKKIKPQFDGKLIFYLMLLKINQCGLMVTLEGKIHDCQLELEKLQPFYSNHHAFWLYYTMEQTYMDKQYFLRPNQNDIQFLQEENMYYDHLTNAPMSAIIAKFHAYDLFREYILQIIRYEEKPVEEQKTIKWKGPKVTWIELGYAFKEADFFDEPLEAFFSIISKTFGVKIDNHSRDWMDVLSRKSEVFSQLKYLMSMAQRRSDRQNENYRAKK